MLIFKSVLPIILLYVGNSFPHSPAASDVLVRSCESFTLPFARPPGPSSQGSSNHHGVARTQDQNLHGHCHSKHLWLTDFWQTQDRQPKVYLMIIYDDIWWHWRSWYMYIYNMIISSPHICTCRNMGVSLNGATPKWMVKIMETLLKWVIWGNHHFRTPPHDTFWYFMW